MKKSFLQSLDAAWSSVGNDIGLYLLLATIVGAGPAYLRVVLRARNKKRQILGELERKSRKLNHDLAQKLATKLARAAKRAEQEKK